MTGVRVAYADDRDAELQVHPRDLAFMLCEAERLDLDFLQGEIVDSEGEPILERGKG